MDRGWWACEYRLQLNARFKHRCERDNKTAKVDFDIRCQG